MQKILKSRKFNTQTLIIAMADFLIQAEAVICKSAVFWIENKMLQHHEPNTTCHSLWRQIQAISKVYVFSGILKYAKKHFSAIFCSRKFRLKYTNLPFREMIKDQRSQLQINGDRFPPRKIFKCYSNVWKDKYYIVF